MGLPAALVCLLALPFHPFWPDYEAARRGLLLIAAGVMAMTARRWWRDRPDAAQLALLGLAGWHLVRSIDVPNASLGLHKGMVWFALAVVYGWARGRKPDEWLRAGVLAGVAVSAYGTAQALGVTQSLHAMLWEQNPEPTTWSTAWLWLQSFLGFDSGTPVSTLGNLNFASEFVGVASAGAAVLLNRAGRGRLVWAALALGAAYLVVNGSRSGLVALPLACVLVLAQPGEPARRRLVVVSALLAGVGFGLLGHVARGGEPAETTQAQAAESGVARPSTVAVRLLIWESCADMAAERPLLGHGAGQFAVDYPRFRSQREIELSSTGPGGPRSFAVAPKTAHNDHLEILVETGIPGLLLWWWFALAVLRTALRSGPAAAAPWVALLALTLVRSPLGNAPVVVLAVGYAGSLRSSSEGNPAGWPLSGGMLVGGLVAAWIGLGALMSQTAWAAYPRAARFDLGDAVRAEAVQRALSWASSDSDLLSLRLRRRVAAGKAGQRLRAEDVDADLDALAALDPHDTTTLLLRADAANQLGQPGRALGLLAQLYELDPGDPEAALLEAVIHTEQGQPAAAVVALYRAPYPRLRPNLSATFANLAAVAETRGRPAAEGLILRAESAFVAAVDALEVDPQSANALQKISAFSKLLLDEAGVRDDLRPVLLGALSYADSAPDKAIQLGRGALRSGLHLSEPHRRLPRRAARAAARVSGVATGPRRLTLRRFLRGLGKGRRPPPVDRAAPSCSAGRRARGWAWPPPPAPRARTRGRGVATPSRVACSPSVCNRSSEGNARRVPSYITLSSSALARRTHSDSSRMWTRGRFSAHSRRRWLSVSRMGGAGIWRADSILGCAPRMSG